MYNHYTERKHILLLKLNSRTRVAPQRNDKNGMHDEKAHVAAKAAWTENICEFKQVFFCCFFFSLSILYHTACTYTRRDCDCELCCEWCARMFYCAMLFAAIVSSTTSQRLLKQLDDLFLGFVHLSCRFLWVCACLLLFFFCFRPCCFFLFLVVENNSSSQPIYIQWSSTELWTGFPASIDLFRTHVWCVRYFEFGQPKKILCRFGLLSYTK